MPAFRICYFDARTHRVQVVTREFAGAAEAEAAIAAEGHRVSWVEPADGAQTSLETPPASPAAAPPPPPTPAGSPAPAQLQGLSPSDFALTRDRVWITVPERVARLHPLYGVGGWGGLLAALLFLGALHSLVTFFTEFGDASHMVRAAGAPGALLLTMAIVIMLVFVAGNVTTAVMLLAGSRAFVPFAVVYLAISAGLDLVGGLIGVDTARSLIRAAIAGLWIVFVLRSERIKVFTQKRIRADDRFFLQPGLEEPTRALRAEAALTRPSAVRSAAAEAG